jgi:hypothetical protein
MRTKRLSGLAAIALGLGLLAAGGTVAPAALAFGPPRDDLSDLTISQTSSVAWIVDPGDPVTYSLTVKNPSIQVWDPELHRYYTGGATAYGVVVRDVLPTGSQFVSASGDSGFSCSHERRRDDTGGTIVNGARISRSTLARGATDQYTRCVAVPQQYH